VSPRVAHLGLDWDGLDGVLQFSDAALRGGSGASALAQTQVRWDSKAEFKTTTSSRAGAVPSVATVAPFPLRDTQDRGTSQGDDGGAFPLRDMKDLRDRER
jgi:hypothetical protein